MRVYEVQPGDSPASIAAQENMAGCPKCSADLVRANPHKPAVRFPNGFTTFKSLVPGEKLVLPEKWFDGELDTRPKSYFAALPHPDGRTPSTLGDAAAGILGDYATLDAANAKVSALATMNDQPFNAAANDAADTIDAAVREITGTGSPAVYAVPFAQQVRKSTSDARQQNAALAAAIASGSEGFQARSDVLHSLSDAMVSARLALQAFYGDPSETPVSSVFPAAVVAAAQAAVNAINADPNFCTAVAKPGSLVNAAVHAFKTAWNATQSPPIPIGTSNYEQATAEVLADVIGGAPLPCEAHPISSSPKPPVVLPPIATVPRKEPLSVGAVAGIGFLAAGVIGGAVYLSTQKRRR